MAQWFQLTVNPWELVVRGSVMYVGLLLAFRFVLRRETDSVNMADLLFIVIVADAAQNALSGEYKSVGDGAVLVGTLIAWNVLLDWLAFRSRFFRRIIQRAPLPLIEDGRLLRANLKRMWITAEEVQSKLREAGIDDVAKVKRAFLEPSGELGLIRYDER